MAPGPAHLFNIWGPALSAKKPSVSKKYLKIEKKGPAHDRNIFLVPGSAAHKTGTVCKDYLNNIFVNKE